MLLAECYVQITGKMQGLHKSLQEAQKAVDSRVGQMQKSLDKYEKGIKVLSVASIGLGTTISAVVTGIIVKTTQMGDAMDKMSLRTGLTTETLSQLNYAAKITGTDIGTVEASLRFLSRAMDDISKGIGEAKETFAKLGIEVGNTDGTLRSVTDVMLEAGDKINALGSETEKVAAITDLFGRRGAALLPLLRQGSVGMKELMERADELGLTISGSSAAAAAEFNDRLTDLRSSIAATSYRLGSLLLPTIQKITERLTEVVSHISEFAEKNSALVSTMLHVAAVIGPMLIGAGVFGLLLTQLKNITIAIKLLGATFIWFAAHPAVAVAGAITLLIGGLALYYIRAKDANDITRQLAKSQEDLGSKSAEVIDILKKRAEEEAESIAKVISRLEAEKGLYEELIRLDKREMGGFRVRSQILSLEALENKILELDNTIAKYREKQSLVTTGLEKLATATEPAVKQTQDLAAAYQALKDSLPTGKDIPAFLEQEPPVPDIEKLQQFVKGAAVAEETSRSLREELAKYQDKIEMGEPDIPFKRMEEMEVGFRQMRERDLAEQKAMADRGEQVSEQKLQEIQDNEEAFWALMETWRQADIARVVAYNQATEQAHLKSEQAKADAYEQGFEDRRKALEMFHQYQIKASEEANKKLQAGWKELVEETEHFVGYKAGYMTDAIEQFSHDSKSATEDFFSDFLQNIDTAEGAWKRFTESLKRSYIDALASMVTESTFDFGKLALGKLPGAPGEPPLGPPVPAGVPGGPLGPSVPGTAAAEGNLSQLAKIPVYLLAAYEGAKAVKENVGEIASGVESVAQMAKGEKGIDEGLKDVAGTVWDLLTGTYRKPKALISEGVSSIIDFFAEGGILPGGLEFPRFQQGGIVRQPTMAVIGEGSKPEAVVPLKGGKIPVDLQGGTGSASVYFGPVNISFPNVDIANMDQANFERRFRNHIERTMRNMTRDGVLNSVMIRSSVR